MTKPFGPFFISDAESVQFSLVISGEEVAFKISREALSDVFGIDPSGPLIGKALVDAYEANADAINEVARKKAAALGEDAPEPIPLGSADF